MNTHDTFLHAFFIKLSKRLKSEFKFESNSINSLAHKVCRNFLILKIFLVHLDSDLEKKKFRVLGLKFSGPKF